MCDLFGTKFGRRASQCLRTISSGVSARLANETWRSERDWRAFQSLDLQQRTDNRSGLLHGSDIDARESPRWWVSMACHSPTLRHLPDRDRRNHSLTSLGREDSGEEDENQQFVPQYDELVAVQICQILLNNGASPHGNVIYEMRPIHIATRRQWMQVVRVLLEAGSWSHSDQHSTTDSISTGVNPNLPEKDLYASRPIDIAVLNDDPPMIQVCREFQKRSDLQITARIVVA